MDKDYAINLLNSIFKNTNPIQKDIRTALKIGINAIKNQSNDGWIPVDEKLPKYDETYYCTVKVKDGIKGMQSGIITGMECVYVNGKWKNVWFQEISHIFDVIAWRPLPKLYKPKKIK